MTKLRFSAGLTHWSGASLASFEAHADLLACVYPFWYGVSTTGLPLRRQDSPPALRQRVSVRAMAAGVEVWPLISSFDPKAEGFNPALMRLVMGDASTRRAHIARLLEYAQEDGAQGIDLDYEDLYDQDRDAFSGFIEELCAAFHAKGLKVGIALPATAGKPGGAGALDTSRLGGCCDRVQIPCLDYHPATGRPGPVSPPDWCAAVIRRALAKVPVGKLEFGVPGGGYNWGSGGSARSLTWDSWDALRQAHPPERRDPTTAELTLKFDGRELWYNDSISIAAKLYQARDLGLDQVALWVLGQEDPRLWALIDTLPDPFFRGHA